eukprot:scaffold69582_cov58-Phaeocystis_antarctica.AAC.3
MAASQRARGWNQRYDLPKAAQSGAAAPSAGSHTENKLGEGPQLPDLGRQHLQLAVAEVDVEHLDAVVAPRDAIPRAWALAIGPPLLQRRARRPHRPQRVLVRIRHLRTHSTSRGVQILLKADPYPSAAVVVSHPWQGLRVDSECDECRPSAHQSDIVYRVYSRQRGLWSAGRVGGPKSCHRGAILAGGRTGDLSPGPKSPPNILLAPQPW